MTVPARRTQLMEETVASALDHVHKGGIPFSAFVVDQDGIILGRGVNRVREHHDPTAHAEVEAIRDACHSHKTTRLAGMTLLASGEPCAICYMTALHAGLAQVLFAVDRDEAATHGFDYRGTYELFAHDPRKWRLPVVRKLVVSTGLWPFLAFRSRASQGHHA
ncbi:MAG TPA: nucleoside deaminase [Mesorhizobium sp.]|jgi:tRNA(Arg) A34 adenosine deaminase TadA|uniref:nucleoside deaminase n=1 Tax=Mesorhizobium sp. TaxID=1871066 RepID=UPI002DDD16BC|nr:nucleoside deaminase [Mesorhizobium sp.]HEV2506436.1 nucleoside deaminase [Mesorhizobium sp.]